MWPHERSLVKHLTGKPFAVIGMNVNGYEVKELKKAMEHEKLTWRSFADPGELGQGPIAKRWNLTFTPTVYLIDHQGVIRHKWLGNPGEKVIDAAVERLVTKAEGSGGG